MSSREAAILREVVRKLVPMIASRGIKVTQQGSQAYVRSNSRTHVPEVVNIPNIPDSADTPFILAIQGFIDHELGHVLFTDFGSTSKAITEGAKIARDRKEPPALGGERLRNLWNIVEDPFVERSMRKRFPGADWNLDKLYDIFIRRITKPSADAALKKGDPADILGVLLVPLVRAWAGQKRFDDWMREGGYYDLEVIKAFTAKVKPETMKLIKSGKTSWDSLEAARHLFDVLYPPPPPPPPVVKAPDMASAVNEESKEKGDRKSDEKSDSDTGKGSNKDKPEDENDKGSGGEKPEGEDDKSEGEKAEGKDEKDEGDGAESDGDAGEEGEAGDDAKSDSKKGKASAGDDEDEGDGKPDDADAADGAGDEASSEGSDASGEDDAEGDSKSDDDRSADGKDGDADEGEADDEAADGSEEAAGGADDDDGDAGDGGKDAGKEDDADDAGDGELDDEGDAGAEPSEEKSAEAGSGKKKASEVDGDAEGDDEEDRELIGDSEEEHIDVTGMEEEESEGAEGEAERGGQGSSGIPDGVNLDGRDLAAAIVKEITDEATRETRDADYRVFTKDYDKIEVLQVKTDVSRTMGELDEKTRHMVAPMQKEIERMMAARSQVVHTPGYRSGRLHGGSLHRLTVNDDRVFRRKQEHKSKETAVSLLIDNSGSMSGRSWRCKLPVAVASGYALSQTLERVGIKHEVLGFTTMNPPNWSQYFEALQKEERRMGIEYSRYEAIYMPIYKGWDERLGTEARRRFAYAIDGGISLANNIDGESVRYATHRLMQRPEPRKVLIVLSDGHPACSTSDDREIYADLHRAVAEAEKAKVETIGIGILSKAVKTFYPKHIVLDDLDKLPVAVMGELKRILVQSAQMAA